MKNHAQSVGVSTKHHSKTGAFRKKAGARHRSRIKKIYATYEKIRSMRKTGKVFGISGERVRQLLAQGTDEGIIAFLPVNILRISGLFKKIDKFDLLRDIEKARRIDEILSKHSITRKELYRLLKCFGLKYSGIKKSASVTRCVGEYLQILNTLNRHPSTFELQSNKSWGLLYYRIGFTWGNMDKFRQAYNF